MKVVLKRMIDLPMSSVMLSGSSRRTSGVLTPLGFGLVYLIVTMVGRRYVDPDLGFATVWPATGVAVGVIVSTRPAWRLRMIATVFVANVTGNLITGASMAAAVGFGIANTLAVAAATQLIRGGARAAVEALRRMWRILAVIAVAGIVGAGVGVAMMSLLGAVEDPARVFRSWALADAVSVLLFAPLMIAFRHVEPYPGWKVALRRVGTGVLAAGLTIHLVQWAAVTDRPALYLVVAAFMLAAVVVGGRTLIVTLAATFIALAELQRAGVGVFVNGGTVEDVLALQAFAAVVAGCSMMMAAIHRRSVVSAGQLRQTLDAAQSAVLVIGEEGSVVLANAVAEQSFGPAVGRSLRDVLGAQLATRVLTEQEAFEALVDTVSGPIPMDFAMGRFADEEGRSTVVVARDLSQRMAAERQVRRLSEVVEASPDFIGFSTPAGIIEYLSPGARRMIGVADEPVEGVAVGSFAPEWAAQLIRDVAVPTAIAEGMWAGESAYLRADGSEVPVSQIVMAHRNDRGELDMLSTMARDLSERVRLERERAELVENLVHDLRNPLVAISGAVEMLVEDARLGDGPPVELVGIIEAGAERLRRLVEELIADKRLNDAPPTKETIDLCGLVQGVVSLHVLPATRSSVSLVMRGTPARVHGHRRALHRMVENLVTNAIKYSPRGGHVEVAIEVEGADAVLRVTDEGIGIDAADLPTMFERYRRATTATAAGIAGSGIGLAMCRQVAESHGGTIGVQSRPGVGSVFEVRLPRVGAHEPVGTL